MKRISLDNGHSFMEAAEAIGEIMEKGLWEQVAELMDDETRELVAYRYGCETELDFLEKYLEEAHEDLIIG